MMEELMEIILRMRILAYAKAEITMSSESVMSLRWEKTVQGKTLVLQKCPEFSGLKFNRLSILQYTAEAGSREFNEMVRACKEESKPCK